jgi:hypothetical protein
MNIEQPKFSNSVTTSPTGEFVPLYPLHPLVPGGGAHSHAGEGWGGGVPIPTRGHTLWYSRYILYVLRVGNLPLKDS